MACLYCGTPQWPGYERYFFEGEFCDDKCYRDWMSNGRRPYVPPPRPPSSADAFNKGLEYYKKNDFDKAIIWFTKAIERDNNNWAAWNLRGTSYYYNLNLEQAIKDLTEAIRLKDDDSDAYFTRASAYRCTGKKNEAINGYNKVISIGSVKDDVARAKIYIQDIKTMLLSNNAQDALDEGRDWADKGDLGRAFFSFIEAIRLNPSFADAWAWRAVSRVMDGAYQQAIRDAEEALRLNSNSIAAHAARGEACVNIGAKQPAINSLEQAIRLGQGNKILIDYLNQLLFKAKQLA